MHAFSMCFLMLGILVFGSAPVAGQEDTKGSAAPAKTDKGKEGETKKHRGKFTISKETTYVTGLLDKDGYPDYTAALNEKLGKGVTPQNNANVLIWKALGPHPEKKPVAREFFEQMGMEVPNEQGDYFIELAEGVR
ncbi:MAG TPA: hypothetical protein VGX70_18275 [Gemmataceae bacterium]|nr:hypothetical protein [Gemmataceae bacterium]